MKQMTGFEFRTAVEGDPAWASKLTEPVEITGVCNLENSSITHLSPLLHFREDAFLKRNAKLKIAEGHFYGFVDFEGSNIEKIGDLETRSGPGLQCDLSKTPLAKKDPVQVVRIMTRSSDLEVWEEQAKLPGRWPGTCVCIQEAIRIVKKERLIRSLTPKREAPLEI
jgi:hypothetical protein